MERVKILINPDYSFLRREIEEKISEILVWKREGEKTQSLTDKAPCEGEFIYKGRNRLYRIKTADKNLIVKDFKKPNLLNRYVYTLLRKSKARRSYENSLRMLESGFKTPKPIAYCEVKDKMSLKWSFYLSEELTDAAEMRSWETHPNIDKILPEFANEILRLHKAKILHKDFSPGNILYKKGESGKYDFYYVDLNRMKFGVSDDKRLMRMFRAINLKPEETEKLARLYAKAAGKNEEETVKAALEELDGYFAEQRRKKRLKNYFC